MPSFHRIRLFIQNLHSQCAVIAASLSGRYRYIKILLVILYRKYGQCIGEHDIIGTAILNIIGVAATESKRKSEYD